MQTTQLVDGKNRRFLPLIGLDISRFEIARRVVAPGLENAATLEVVPPARRLGMPSREDRPLASVAMGGRMQDNHGRCRPAKITPEI